MGGEKRNSKDISPKGPDPNFAKKNFKLWKKTNARARFYDFDIARFDLITITRGYQIRVFFILITHSLIHTTYPSLSKRHREEIIIRRKQKREQEEYNDFAFYQRTATRITRR